MHRLGEHSQDCQGFLKNDDGQPAGYTGSVSDGVTDACIQDLMIRPAGITNERGKPEE